SSGRTVRCRCAARLAARSDAVVVAARLVGHGALSEPAQLLCQHLTRADRFAALRRKRRIVTSTAAVAAPSALRVEAARPYAIVVRIGPTLARAAASLAPRDVATLAGAVAGGVTTLSIDTVTARTP